MKTQLLEDIGQSATLSLEHSGKVANAESRPVEQVTAQPPPAKPVKPRAAFGVWRQKPESEPVALVTPPPSYQAPPEQAPPPPLYEPFPQGPVFDFTLPSPTAPAPEQMKDEPSRLQRSGRRYLLWGSCVLASALVVQVGWWLYGEQKNSTELALVADEFKDEPQFNKAVKRRATSAKEFTLGPDGEVQVAPAATPAPVPKPSQPVPPLVLLEPEPVVEKMAETVVAAVPIRKKVHVAPKPAPVEEQLHTAAEKKAESESAMAATLKACREHGYHPAQCVKRGCSVTKFGFVCRG
jgi:hypothetical protein